MQYIDCHCDTLTELKEGETLRCNQCNVSLQALREAECMIQFCSIFIPTGTFPQEDKKQRIAAEYQRILTNYRQELNENSAELTRILSYQNVIQCQQNTKTGILLTIEDGGVFMGDINRLHQAYEDGVRLVTLTWNHENEIGFPNSTDADIMCRGLKPFGYEVLEELCRLGMLVDVSHLSDGGFLDTAEFMKKRGLPFAASHSNARAVCGHQRNLPDAYIRILAEGGGIMGLNFAAHFLKETERAEGSSRIEDMVKHILHIRNVGGTEVLAIGSDFDGVASRLEIDSPLKMHLLYEALHKAGMTERELEKMFYQNVLRVLEEVLEH